MCYNLDMKTITDMVATEVRLNYVGASWVAWHYGVTRQQVYRATNMGLLPFVEVPNRIRIIHLYDRRLLPHEFPVEVRQQRNPESAAVVRARAKENRKRRLRRAA